MYTKWVLIRGYNYLQYYVHNCEIGQLYEIKKMKPNSLIFLSSSSYDITLSHQK